MEEWRKVPEWPEYSVSNLGRVRGPRCILKPAIGRDGYLRVAFFRNNKGKNFRVNRLVCEVFHSTPPTSEHMALHRDGDRRNNIPQNLYWGTHEQNTLDQIRLDERAYGERNGNRKLDWEKVRHIRVLASGGLKAHSIAPQVGISHRHCRQIIKNNVWPIEKDPEYANN